LENQKTAAISYICYIFVSYDIILLHLLYKYCGEEKEGKLYTLIYECRDILTNMIRTQIENVRECYKPNDRKTHLTLLKCLKMLRHQVSEELERMIEPLLP